MLIGWLIDGWTMCSLMMKLKKTINIKKRRWWKRRRRMRWILNVFVFVCIRCLFISYGVSRIHSHCLFHIWIICSRIGIYIYEIIILLAVFFTWYFYYIHYWNLANYLKKMKFVFQITVISLFLLSHYFWFYGKSEKMTFFEKSN